MVERGEEDLSEEDEEDGGEQDFDDGEDDFENVNTDEDGDEDEGDLDVDANEEADDGSSGDEDSETSDMGLEMEIGKGPSSHKAIIGNVQKQAAPAKPKSDKTEKNKAILKAYLRCCRLKLKEAEEAIQSTLQNHPADVVHLTVLLEELERLRSNRAYTDNSLVNIIYVGASIGKSDAVVIILSSHWSDGILFAQPGRVSIDCCKMRREL